MRGAARSTAARTTMTCAARPACRRRRRAGSKLGTWRRMSWLLTRRPLLVLLNSSVWSRRSVSSCCRRSTALSGHWGADIKGSSCCSRAQLSTVMVPVCRTIEQQVVRGVCVASSGARSFGQSHRDVRGCRSPVCQTILRARRHDGAITGSRRAQSRSDCEHDLCTAQATCTGELVIDHVRLAPAR